MKNLLSFLLCFFTLGAVAQNSTGSNDVAILVNGKHFATIPGESAHNYNVTIPLTTPGHHVIKWVNPQSEVIPAEREMTKESGPKAPSVMEISDIEEATTIPAMRITNLESNQGTVKPLVNQMNILPENAVTEFSSNIAFVHSAGTMEWKMTTSEGQIMKPLFPENYLNSQIAGRNSIAGRFTKIDKVIEIDADEKDSIRVDVYDNGVVDNDSISVYIGNDIIISKQKVSTKNITFYFSVADGDISKILTMQALNLGLIPPNTAVMKITTSKSQHTIFLTSDLEKNAAVQFVVKPGTTIK